MKRTSVSKRERGTQLVELAIVLPLLAFLALLVSEGADFVRVHVVINNAAREGARLAALKENTPTPTATLTCSNNPPSDVRGAVCRYMINETAGKNIGLNMARASVTVVQTLTVPSNNGSGTIMMGASQVTVTYLYQFTYLPNFLTGNVPVNLTATSEMRNLY